MAPLALDSPADTTRPLSGHPIRTPTYPLCHIPLIRTPPTPPTPLFLFVTGSLWVLLRSPLDQLWRKHPHFPLSSCCCCFFSVWSWGDLHMSVNAEKMFTQHNCLAEGAGEWHSAQHGATAAPGYREKKREKYIPKKWGDFFEELAYSAYKICFQTKQK